MNTQDLFFALLRYELKGEALPEEAKKPIGEEQMAQLCKLASAHDLGHLVSDALERNGLATLLTPSGGALHKHKLFAIWRGAQIDHELMDILTAFAAAGIPCVPLKGAVIRDYYPENWMRTSGDIDLLVKEEDLMLASSLLYDRFGYHSDGSKDYHDLPMTSPSGLRLELHFSIMEDTENIDRLLSKVWDYTEAQDGNILFQTPEYFVFHHIAHMSYHFMKGGCGVRSLLDLWILRNRYAYDDEKTAEYCRICGIDRFYEQMKRLCDCWMNGGEKDALLAQAEAFILSGGVYGTLENKVAVKQQKAGGRRKYIRERLFLPREQLARLYPVLNDHPSLLPLMQVRRWWNHLLHNRKESFRELRLNIAMTDDEKESAAGLLRSLGL